MVAQHEATLQAPAVPDTRDFDDASRGFLAPWRTRFSPQGRVVWSLEPYGFLSAEQAPPPTVD